tara:strand:+ start:209 stop:478 length:270 start_codon:yes stop_codon:yes gene_type:complete
MKKYSDVLKEQAAKHKPMKRDELDTWKAAHSGRLEEGSVGVMALLGEIEYLRGLVGECYMWMGVRPRTPLPKKFQWAMAEADRIRREDR